MSEGKSAVNWILVVALVAALLVIAFLLGRETKVEDVGGPVAIIERVAPAEAASAEAAPEPVRRARRTDDVVITNRGGGEARIEQGEADAPRPRRVPTGSNAVEDYFAAVDEIQAGPQGISPRGFAQGLAGDIGSGDTEGLDLLKKELERATLELQDIEPPVDCRAYHTTLLETVRDSHDMLDAMGEAMAGGGGLEKIAGKARALQRRQAQLERMRKQLIDG